MTTQHELVFTLIDTAARLTRRLDRSLSMIKGISFSEYQLLGALTTQPNNASPRVELAERVGLTPSGVTRALKPLEKLGFVETIKDDRDARRSLAALTSAGLELHSDASGVVNDALESLSAFGSTPAAERDQVLRILRELAQG